MCFTDILQSQWLHSQISFSCHSGSQPVGQDPLESSSEGELELWGKFGTKWRVEVFLLIIIIRKNHILFMLNHVCLFSLRLSWWPSLNTTVPMILSSVTLQAQRSKVTLHVETGSSPRVRTLELRLKCEIWEWKQFAETYEQNHVNKFKAYVHLLYQQTPDTSGHLASEFVRMWAASYMIFTVKRKSSLYWAQTCQMAGMLL